MSNRSELERIERRRRLADARFRGESASDGAADEVSPGELLLGGALIGLLVLAALALVMSIVALVTGKPGKRTPRSR